MTKFTALHAPINSFFTSKQTVNTNLKIFQLINNKIIFYRFDTKSKKWSAGQIDDVLDAKYIVGLKDELYFVGCGFNRTIVRSYHIEQEKWTARGNLRHEHKETYFKAIVLNGSIFVVMCELMNNVSMCKLFLFSWD